MPSGKNAALSMWVVYSSPSDYPGQFVASKTAAVPIQLITGAESWGAQASFSF